MVNAAWRNRDGGCHRMRTGFIASTSTSSRVQASTASDESSPSICEHGAMTRVDIGTRTWPLFNSLSPIRITEINRNSAVALFDDLELHIINTEPKQGRTAGSTS
ncbi:BZ3500_MvSof-1268-A1-R1_Chr11-2g03360 [Microbotryum saponariae]|uniref:BZ3500_MvSof-1268-A1-R1_Chr11-2g03360 protein n=1 Tax=Microbotryum saponariae TaxID=289078 RepID=A0A2X0KTZ9_9BASI|nr:BZ3500_MvSof-1268-A1-R1_Chr11-2g03360 [Microbotryum saponariae]SDA03200.1 BZ3501_MvSof-1269-A2-R1_Chr11g02931 [Microbotryum saponariae]